MRLPGGVTSWVAQEVGGPPIEGFAQYGVLGLVVMALAWFAWQQVKQLRSDLVEARADLKEERSAHNATRDRTATMLQEATRAMEAMARRREP